MIVKIPAFIVKMVNAVARMVATVVRETHDNLVFCLKLYLWEEKMGVPHPHALEEVSKVFRVGLKDIQTVYSILKIRYQEVKDLELALTKT